MQQYEQLELRLQKMISARDYEGALAVCREQAAIVPEHPGNHYNIACMLSRLGRKADAVAALRETVRRGWLDSEFMLRDEDLAALREDGDFADLVATVKANEMKAFEGHEMPGVRTIRGKPEGGFRYRLRMSPDAGRENPNRLVVWLHPSGGSMNDTVEAMAPSFLKRGFALLVITQKDFSRWSDQDVAKLDATIAEVARQDGIRAARPVLFGFSAGGQMALFLWKDRPAAYGGIALDAAYPVKYRAGRPEPDDNPQPKGDVKGAPMFVVVGSKDGNAAIWRKTEPKLRALGVDLTVIYVPEKGHSWLFDRERIEALEKWLAGLGVSGSDLYNIH
jgi:predicted esterase